MASTAPLQAHFTADKLTIRDASTLNNLEKGIQNLDLAAGGQE